MAENYDASLGNGFILRLNISHNAPDVANNRTFVNWSVQLVQGGSFEASSSFNNPWSVTINGSYYSGTRQYNFFNYNALTMGSGGQWVTHNSDGTKSINVKSSFNDVANDYLSDGSTNNTYVLPNIPRNSTASLTPQPVDAGSVLTINTNRASADFTHTIQYFFGDASGTLATGVTTSYAWTVPMSLLNEWNDSLTGTGVIRLLTYDGNGTYMGYRDTTLVIRVPASVVPSVGTINNSEATSGVAANVGRYVQNISRLAINVTGSAGIYGSTIVSTKIEVAGQTINAASGTTTPINASGTVPIKVTVTDSRGRSAVKTQNVTVLAYSPPKITSLSVQRSLASGAPDENGTYLRVNFNVSVSSLINTTQRNSLRRIVSVSVHDAVNYVVKSNVLQAVGDISFNSYVVIGTYSVSTPYDVLLEVQDDFSETISARTVPTARIAMHWDGNIGVGIGKYREQGVLDVGGDIYQNGNLVLDLSDRATQAEAEAGVASTAIMTAQRTKQAIDYAFATLPRIDTGFDAVPSVPSGGSINMTINFEAGLFTQAPNVQATTTIDRHEVVVSSVTTSSAVLRFTNRTALAAAGDVHWLAIQK